jgi:DNA-binding transcriptional LysR family regulator
MLENLNYYNVFYTVGKTGSISKAAAHLYISQPAVSKAISNLESNIGVSLFVRNSRGVSLSEEGQLLYEYIERAMENITKGEENIKKYSELGMGHIRIGVSTSLCKHILLDYLKDFIKENPHIKFSIDCHSTINTIKLLKNDDIDIGIICNTELPKGITYSPIKEIHDIFVASSDYVDNFNLRENEEDMSIPHGISGNILGNVIPIISTSSSNHKEIQNTFQTDYLSAEMTKELLEKSNLMVLEESNVTRTHVDNYLRKHNIQCSQVLEINNMDLLIDFAAIGMGVASVVKEFSLSQLNSGQIMELPLEPPIDVRTVGLAYSENKKQSHAVRKFIEYIQ